MENPRNQCLVELIAEATNNRPVAVQHRQTCSGGCIHQAELMELVDGRRFFVKSSQHSAAMFELEAQGLAALAATNTLRIPQVIATGSLGGQEACLILEAIESGTQVNQFFEVFGRAFAAMHRADVAPLFGWSSDNYLGSSVQRNSQNEDWIEFFAECRLRSQLRTARHQGVGSHELFKLCERVIDRLEGYLGTPSDPPSLLHGDLWSGNWLPDENGHPVIFDPAIYYGRREADLAMPLLFGGFSASFFEAYQEAWPLEDGWQDRVELYKLVHLLNHLNLFGSGYLESCLEIVRRFA